MGRRVGHISYSPDFKAPEGYIPKPPPRIRAKGRIKVEGKTAELWRRFKQQVVYPHLAAVMEGVALQEKQDFGLTSFTFNCEGGNHCGNQGTLERLREPDEYGNFWKMDDIDAHHSEGRRDGGMFDLTKIILLCRGCHKGEHP